VDDCQVCNAGGTLGSCAPRPDGATFVCRSAQGLCDLQEPCASNQLECPSDAFLALGSVCGQGAECNSQHMCIADDGALQEPIPEIPASTTTSTTVGEEVNQLEESAYPASLDNSPKRIVGTACSMHHQASNPGWVALSFLGFALLAFLRRRITSLV